VRLVFEEKIRYGEKIISLKDGISELYQIVFKELTGILVDNIYINRHLKRYSKKDFNYNMLKSV
jgi:hypothetical protein